ncbi:dihydromonapterin reductase [Aestuariirhabdus sp. Z084]|uniref:dihydromonapterin reductase n=1 Tax=Aestuariirhabdus haliotis TaxID=2918751 RepID=UPI00201B3BF9|nr:dihydromonapterin reductase [Aestuariirhabdus haliotis]MCL6416047.1 dihydromonapterin reductase [Aestuariirhabdus haliotis]MCL6419385.1 dihydromonapterin reductase [Aestuariirhabdus haliotis]
MPAPVLITGIAKRIGLHIARALIKQGIPVIGTYRRRHDSLSELEVMGVQLYHCDFYDTDQVEQLITSVQNNHTELRGIIHNASDWLGEGESDLAPSLVMERMMRVHAFAPYQLNLGLADQLKAYSEGTADIIHITDFAVKKASKKHIAYAASKAASENMSRSFARLLAPEVKVNSIAPSLILFNEDDSEEYRQHTLKKALIPVEPGPEEIYNAISFLMNSDYMTGRTLHLDGGRHLK